jgi:hypothetical protein
MPLWDWAEVAVWFYLHHRLSREVVIEAAAAKIANSVIGKPQIKRELKEGVKAYEARL